MTPATAPATGKAPVLPALTLTTAEHQQAKALLDRLEESVLARGHDALMELRTLLRIP